MKQRAKDVILVTEEMTLLLEAMTADKEACLKRGEGYRQMLEPEEEAEDGTGDQL